MLRVALFAATAAVHFHFIEKTVFQSWLSLHCNSSGSLSLSLAKCQATRASQTKLGLRLQIKCITRNIPLFLSLSYSLFCSLVATHLNCINNLESKKFNDCRFCCCCCCRHLSLLAQRCLMTRPPRTRTLC